MTREQLGTIGEGGCMCGEVKTEHYAIAAHCHRTSRCGRCSFGGVHIESSYPGYEDEALAFAKELAEYLGENYRTDVAIQRNPIDGGH